MNRELFNKTTTLNGLSVLPAMPEGWRVVEGAQASPKGHKVISNGKGYFTGKRQCALIKVESLNTF